MRKISNQIILDLEASGLKGLLKETCNSLTWAGAIMAVAGAGGYGYGVVSAIGGLACQELLG